MSFRVKINLGNALNQIGSYNGYTKMRTQFANEFIKATDPFVPFDEGYLFRSALIEDDGSKISWNMPYATRLYYNPQYNFKGAPQRGGLWVERSYAVNIDEVLKSIRISANRGDFK